MSGPRFVIGFTVSYTPDEPDHFKVWDRNGQGWKLIPTTSIVDHILAEYPLVEAKLIEYASQRSAPRRPIVTRAATPARSLADMMAEEEDDLQ